jgi:hypothetical protein
MNNVVVAYGGGTNSTAMLVHLRRNNIVPGLILFADTGGERPQTYRAIETTSQWCADNGFPPIRTVRYATMKGAEVTLEEDCLRRKALPSLAYGWKTCSDRWKQRPQQKAIRAFMREHGFKTVTQMIGFDADEERRMKTNLLRFITNQYPLIEAGLYRDDCVQLCAEAGLPHVKSACFFCPSSKKHEILDLKLHNPDLLQRALDMEANAELLTVQGLGRSFNWKRFLNGIETSTGQPPEQDCGCYDG